MVRANSCSYLSKPRLDRTQHVKLDAKADWLPLEVEHRMDRWDLYPPVSSLHGLPDQTRIITWDYYELVTVFDISVGEGDFRFLFLRLATIAEGAQD